MRFAFINAVILGLAVVNIAGLGDTLLERVAFAILGIIVALPITYGAAYLYSRYFPTAGSGSRR
jgi:hypothetical protein